MALGTLLAEQGQLEQAVQRLQQAVEAQPASARARHNLGVGLGVLGRLHDARAQLEEALRLQPDYPEAHYNLGNILNSRAGPTRRWPPSSGPCSCGRITSRP